MRRAKPWRGFTGRIFGLSEGWLMLRWLTGFTAAVALMAAAPSQQQPVPEPTSPEARASDVTRTEADRKRKEEEQVARDRAWDARWKQIERNEICKGC